MVLHFSFPLAFGTPQQSIESIIGVGNHVTNGVDVGDGGDSVGDDGGGGGYGGLIVVAGHRHKVFGGKMRRLDVLLTVDTARAVGSGGGRGFHPVFRARGLSFGSLNDTKVACDISKNNCVFIDLYMVSQRGPENM